MERRIGICSHASIIVVAAIVLLAPGAAGAQMEAEEIEDSLRALQEYAEVAAAAESSGSGNNGIDANAYRQQVEQLDAALEAEGATAQQLQQFRQRAESIGEENGILE